MKYTENSGEIIIRHVPLFNWIIGGSLTCISFFFILWFVYRSYVNSFGNWSELIDVLFIIAIFVVALFEIKMIRAPLVTLIVKAETQSVDIVRQRFYGKKTQRFHFTQTNKFKSYKSKIHFSEKYFLALVLANRRTKKLGIPIGGDKQETVKFIKNLNKFIKSNKLSVNTVNEN